MMLAALLIILSCTGLHTFRTPNPEAAPEARNVSLLSLAPDTFDDAYVGCSELMEEKAAPLLEEEMARHPQLRESWGTAQKAWERRRPGLSLPPGFQAQHGIAIMVYTNSSNTLYRELNQAVQTLGDSQESYMTRFPFKALHFYLTRGLQLLQSSGGCSRGPGETVFRGVSSLRFAPKGLGDSVRFGQFASSSKDEAVARRFGTATFFSLRTCFGAPIEALSVFPDEREVLILPHEVFFVTNFSQHGAQNLVTLSSGNQLCSYFNCAYLGEKKRLGCEPVPPRGQASSLFKGAFPLLVAFWGFQLLGAGL
uniref:NAD(P)(+)--arginine ADP-ribosyltransferase n=1 Tax=Sus scrofa TaxID=9823 RepID=A0A8D0Q888_PIG